jgi:ligand-binding sensor domain-containing protein/signal transduction histidine kinase/DNA-binding NarL/FixJ family response regulator
MQVKLLVSLALWVLSNAIAFAQLSRLFTSDNGLSNSQINQIYQDRKGFVWVATEDGLNQFDGTRFTVYRHQSDNQGSIASNFVHTVFEDDNNNFWVGTMNGLQLFNRVSNRFEMFPLNTLNDASTFPHVTSIIQDRKGYLWVCTSGHGLMRINPKTLTVIGGNELKGKLGSIYLTTIFEDQNGLMWIGTEDKGLTILSPATGNVDFSMMEQAWVKKLSDKQISAIVEDRHGNVVIGTLNGGMGVYLRGDNRFRFFDDFTHQGQPIPVKALMKDASGNIWVGTDGNGIIQVNEGRLVDFDIKGSLFSIKKMKVHSLLLDQQGNIWAGLFHKGVMMLPQFNNKFDYYGYSPMADFSIGNSCVMSIAVANDGTIWTGTDGNGLFRVDPVTHLTKQYAKESGAIPGNTVMSLAFDNTGDLWVGTYFNGLVRFNTSTGKSVKVGLGLPFENDKIFALATDTSNSVWIGTYGKGVFNYNPSTQKYVQLTDSMSADSAKRLTNNWVNVLEFDQKGHLWIGTFKGVDSYDPATGIFTHYNVDNGFLCDNVVYCLLHDREGNVWIGTSNGLTCMDAKRKSASFFTTKNGLPGNVINGIKEDANGNLWLSTNAGLSRYSPSLQVFTNFYSFEGLQANEFRRGAAFKSRDGRLFFGGINGITAFYPQNIGLSKAMPDLFFTDFKIFNQSVEVGQKTKGTTILDKSIMERPKVTIRHSDNVFSIEFITLEYANPEKIVYSYKMEGFDNDWKTTDVSNRLITYTNLNPGSYKFHVVASDNFSNQKKSSLVIQILPPWWRTWWAFVIYLVTGAGALLLVLREIHYRVEQTHLLMEAQNAEKINEAKLQLFANISHEIRTPLTLIINPLEKLRAMEADAEKQSLMDLIHRNSLRILRLMTQLMDIRKIDKGQFELRFRETDLVTFIKDVMASFEFAAKSKNIRFFWDSPLESLMVWIDRDNFDKVLFNLISNAFKFTADGGEVIVSLRKANGNKVVVSVEDNGIGIEEDALTKVFDRFYQVKREGAKGGWGIGLHLSQKLVEMHLGTIVAKQKQPTGTIFEVELPLGNSHLQQEQMATESAENTRDLLRQSNADEWVAPAELPKQKGKSRIVIAEDDDEIRSYLVRELGTSYQVIDASNGKKAWALVAAELPDLLLSDIMMPEMSGLELCRKVKTNANTSHIPVVLLTARSKDEDMVDGLEHGADHYISKPFNIDVLKSVIQRAIESRQALKVSYSRDVAFNYGGMKLDSADEKLMAKFMSILQSNMSDPTMSVETLSRQIGISRVHLHRKLKELTALSPRDLIKHIRLTQAAHLLAASHVNVSEVAFAVGFSSHAYFTNCFRDQFGVSPTEFVDKAKNSPDDPLVRSALQYKGA